MTLLEDRTRVQTLLGKNMVVEAGAGTGKTTLLIDRLCLCVLAQGTPVEKLVALTFTDKAAAEIKTRFMHKLQQVLQALHTPKEDRTLELLRADFQVPDADLIQRAQNTLAHLERANIGTIHSFCAEILKSFPLEAGLSPNAQIDTGQKARQLFDIRWNRFLDTELGLHAPQPQRWKKVLGEITLTELKSFAQELARLKPVEYDYFSHAQMIARLCTQKSARALELYNLYVPTGKKPRALEQALQWAAQTLQYTSLFLQHQPVPHATSQTPTLGSTVYKEWDPADDEEARALIRFAKAVMPEKQMLFLEAYQLLSPLAKEVAADCQAEGVLSFDDLIIKTRNLLQYNLQVRALLKNKFDVLFIDEFQDTDPVQGELLLFLAEQPGSIATTWQEVRLQPGKLFVVGDPKQSIYRFRGADITAYEKFTRLLLQQGGEKCFLRQNFRSKTEIIELTNQVCSRAMVQESEFQPAYEPIFTPHKTAAQAVEWLFIKPDPARKAQADDYRQNQAEQIAQWIAQHVGKLILSNGHVLSLTDIAILTRASTSLQFYTNALRRYGIAFQTETNKDFFRKQEINDFILLLRAIANPADGLALAGVLRSPLGGLTDEELLQLSQNGFTLNNLLTHPKTKQVGRMIERFCQLAGRVDLPTLIHTILTETFLPEACAAAYDAEQTLLHLNQFAVWAAQAGPQGTLLTFIADLERILAEQPDDLNIPPAHEAQAAVSILTVHKSKGLEFPVVILADLSRKELTAPTPPQHLFSWQHHMYGLRAGKISDVNLAFLQEEQKKHSQCEEIRILYVSLTRAKEKLLLVADGRCGTEKTTFPFLQAQVFPDGTQEVLAPGEGALQIPVRAYPYLPPKDFIYNQHSLPTQQDPISASLLTQWKHQHEDRKYAYEKMQKTAHALAPSQQETNELFTKEQRRGAELGTLCHRALELLVSNAQTEVAAACARAAQQLALPDRQAEALAVLTPFVHAPVFAQMRACRVLACEMPFTLALEDGNIQNGLMDVVLETPAGEIWVIDYKTDQVSAGQENTLFEQKYRGQLAAYQAAARKIFPGKTIKCSAIFIRTFAAIEL